jgi:hypothetical protein
MDMHVSIREGLSKHASGVQTKNIPRPVQTKIYPGTNKTVSRYKQNTYPGPK